jgi:glycoprotein-N-acetylgalactosamine 3-beta-galactosyltransferase
MLKLLKSKKKIYLLIIFTFIVLAIHSFVRLIEIIEFRQLDNILIKDSQGYLFCIILTRNDSLNSKARLIYDTWAKHCDNYKFISTFIKGNLSDPSNGVEAKINGMNLLQPPNYFDDNYEKLTDKVYSTFKYLFENKKYNRYEWYLKADDDTYIFIDNLRRFLSDKDSYKSVTYGYDINKDVPGGYHSGGAGYLLSKRSFNLLGNALSKRYSFCPNSGIEDIDIGYCLRKLNVYPEKSTDFLGRERFHLFNISTHYYGHYEFLFEWVIKYSKNGMKKVNFNSTF